MSTEDQGPQLSPEAYRTLVEGVPAVLYIDEPDDLSTPRYTSPQIMDVLGYSPAEWDGHPSLWVNQLHPEDRAGAVEAHHTSNRARERFFAEYRIYAKDGRLVWLRDEASPVFGDEGQLLYWRGVMLDITEQKEAESKLRWSLDVLRRTIQQRRELAARLGSAQEEERRRIAADIHDDPIQVMSAWTAHSLAGMWRKHWGGPVTPRHSADAAGRSAATKGYFRVLCFIPDRTARSQQHCAAGKK